jgi:hypothetical protein
MVLRSWRPGPRSILPLLVFEALLLSVRLPPVTVIWALLVKPPLPAIVPWPVMRPALRIGNPPLMVPPARVMAPWLSMPSPAEVSV